jgi:aspartyl-tRNA(Asn)/glutamyl-tRNA(Gln) amidotransferase subunit C
MLASWIVMSRTLDESEVRRIAALAHLRLSPDEVTLFTRQLANILQYAGELQAVDTSGVEPTSHPLAVGPVWREDDAVPSIDRAAVLSQATGASVQNGLFKVPKVL